MRVRIYTFILFIFVAFSQANGQEKNYSYYHYTPLTVNPANAGAFSGSYRVSGIFSDKHSAIAPNPFRNMTLSADAPIIRGIRKQDWIGVGVQMDVIGKSGSNFIKDQQPEQFASDLSQSWTVMKFGASYHFALDKKQTNILTLGAQMSIASRNYSQLAQQDGRVYWEYNMLNDADIDKFNSQPDQQSQRIEYRGYKDLNIGLLFNARRKKSDLRMGAALVGVLNPKIGFNSSSVSTNSSNVNKDSVETKYYGINFHGSYDMEINSKTHVEPAFYYYGLGPANAFNVNTHVWYKVNEEKDFRAGAGLGLRNLRAAIIYLGAEFKDLRVGFAYDITLSSANIGDRSFGGFEICASYLGKIYKKPKVKPVIFCPRL